MHYKGHGYEVSQRETKVFIFSPLDEPEVKAERAAVHAGVGYQVELVCVVYSEPVADVLWYKDTMLLDANGSRYMQKKGNRHTLLIRNVRLEDFGNYSCSASNMLGKARAYITVQGQYSSGIRTLQVFLCHFFWHQDALWSFCNYSSAYT